MIEILSQGFSMYVFFEQFVLRVLVVEFLAKSLTVTKLGTCYEPVHSRIFLQCGLESERNHVS